MKKQPKQWLVFSSLAFQIAIVMYLAIKAGKWLDNYFEQNKFWTLVLCVIGIISILILISRQSK